jgi:hypothetical protein
MKPNLSRQERINMTTTDEEAGSRFIVDLGEIKLPRLLEKQVAAEIQTTVLRALAKSDFGGSRRARLSIPIWDQFPGRTLGLWIGPQDLPPFIFRSGTFAPLSVPDHTLIVRAVMEHAFEVIRYLPDRYKSKTDRPTGKEVLQAALRVNRIDDTVKARIRAVLEVLPKLEAAEAGASESFKQAVDDIRRQLTSKPVEKQRDLLRDERLRSTHRESGLAAGMEIAAQMLEDGEDSIYSADFGFYELLQEGQESSIARDALSDIGSADTIGATVGGAIGTFAGGVGAGPGAIAGGTAASAGTAIKHIFDWLF